MNKELGKWFMDIAKYILTAVILSTFFGDIDKYKLYWFGLGSTALALLIGILLISENKIISKIFKKK